MGKRLRAGKEPWKDLDGEQFLLSTSVDHTELKRIEAALAEAREATDKELAYLRMALQASKSGWYDLDLSNGVGLLSQEFEEIYGVRPGELSGKTMEDWEAFVIPEDVQQVRADIRRAIDEGDAISSLFRIRRLDNSDIRWIEARGHVLYDPDHRPLRMIGINTDVTERRKAETELLLSEERFRTITDASPDGIAVVDTDGTISYASPTIMKLFGYADSSEIIGRPPLQWVATEDRERARTAISRLVRGEYVGRNEYQLVKKDGTTFWGEIHSSAMRDDKGNPVGMIAVVRDIADRKTTDDELRLRAQLLDAASDSIFLDEADGTIVYANEAAHRLRGYGRGELVGKNIRDLLTPERAQRFESLFRQVIEEKEVLFESVHLRTDGSELPVEVCARTVEVAGRTMILSVSRDITVRMRMEEESRRQLNEMAMVARVSSAIRSASTVGDLLASFLDEALSSVNTSGGGVFLPDRAANELRQAEMRGSCGGDADPFQATYAAIARRVFATGEPVVASDVRLVHEAQESGVSGLPKGRGVALLPIHSTDEVVGVLLVAGESGRIAIPADVHLLSMLAEMPGNAIQRIRLQEQLQHQITLLTAQRAVDAALSSTHDLETVLAVLTSQMTAMPEVHEARVWMYRPGIEALELSGKRSKGEDAPTHPSVRLGEGLVGRAAALRQAVFEGFPDKEGAGSDHWREQREAPGTAVEARCAIPMVAWQQLKGVLEITGTDLLSQSSQWFDFIDALANQAATAIDAAELFRDLESAERAMRGLLEGTVEAIGAAFEMRDPYTAGHERRVANLSTSIGKEMGLPPDQIEGLRIAALLHDAGKIAIPVEILNRPGRLGEIEMGMIRTHPETGYEILKAIEFPWPVARMVLEHHERQDGTGYPNGISGSDIIKGARILAVADVVEAMSSHRPYRPALPMKDAVEEITRGKGVAYDRDVVMACLSVLSRDGFTLD